MTTLSKTQLRSELRQKRNSLTRDEQRAAAQAACSHALALPQWKAARTVALYIACDGEIDTAAIADHCFCVGIQVFLPVVGNHKKMVFAQWRQGDQLIKNRYGIAEPSSAARLQPPSHMDLIFMPLVAWDKTGTRLGMGGGYYDRALAEVKDCTLVGLAHHIQETAALPRQPWDVALDIVVSDRGITDCSQP